MIGENLKKCDPSLALNILFINIPDANNVEIKQAFISKYKLKRGKEAILLIILI